MAYKINGTTVVDNSRNVCACCVTSCCITASSRMDVPSGTTAQRPGSPATGSLYFDTDEGSLVSYDGSAWNTVGGSGGIEIDNIVTDDETAWTFGSVVHQDQSNESCFTYNRCCHGAGPYHLEASMPGTSCHQQDSMYVVNHDGNPCKWAGCGFGYAYVEGEKRYLGIDDCQCRQWFVCRTVPIIYKGYGPGNFICSCLSFGALSNYMVSGYDGSIAQYMQGCYKCFGMTPQCGCAQYMYEHFINKKGGVTFTERIRMLECKHYASNGCQRHPLGTHLEFRYVGISPYGTVAGIRAPLSCFPRASDNFQAPASFVVTSDSWGTGNEETCCWAFRYRSGSTPAWPSTHTLGGHYALNDCICLCPACTLCGDACFWCLQNYSMAQCFHCPCQWFMKCIGTLMSYRDNIYGGGDVTMCDAYCKSVCNFTKNGVLDCMKIMSMQPSCKPFFIMTRIAGVTDTCCLCYSTITCGIGHNCCGVAFFTRDGKCIHWHLKEDASKDTSFCMGKIDTQGPDMCWCCLKRPYDGIINRICQCLKCRFGACCLCFNNAEKCQGCCKICHCVNVYCTGLNSCMYTWGWHTPKPWEHTAKFVENISIAPGCNYPTCSDQCSFQNRTLADFSWNAWSHTRCCKAIFHSFQCNFPVVAIFDCCKQLFEEAIHLNALHNGCEWLKFAQIYSMAPQYIGSCTSGSGPACFFGSNTAVGGASCRCLLRDCICSITGSGSRSMFFHCLGYSIFRQTHTQSYFGILPPGNGFSQNTYRNKENDHIVMIRALKHDSCSCTCGTCIFWLGAICYDIYNKCISKVNTFFPSDTTELARINCRIYCCWCTGGAEPNNERFMCQGYFRCGAVGWYNTNFSSCRVQGSFVSATPYGSRDYWIKSGCTDTGGVTLVMSSVPSEQLDIVCCNSECARTYALEACCCRDCKATGVGGYMRVLPGALQVSRVPYSQPLECIGWRSEPIFACWLNQFFFPDKGGTNSCFPITNNSCAHKCHIACMLLAHNYHVFNYPCNRACGVKTCPYWPVYANDCPSRGMRFKIFKNNCCMWFNCCCTTNAPNGTFCPKMLCVHHFCRYGLKGCTTTCSTIYTGICACHLDENESSKRYISRFMCHEPVKSKPYHIDGSHDAFTGKWLKYQTGESSMQRFRRLWTEDIIRCC